MIFGVSIFLSLLDRSLQRACHVLHGTDGVPPLIIAQPRCRGGLQWHAVPTTSRKAASKQAYISTIKLQSDEAMHKCELRLHCLLHHVSELCEALLTSGNHNRTMSKIARHCLAKLFDRTVITTQAPLRASWRHHACGLCPCRTLQPCAAGCGSCAPACRRFAHTHPHATSPGNKHSQNTMNCNPKRLKKCQ